MYFIWLFLYGPVHAVPLNHESNPFYLSFLQDVNRAITANMSAPPLVKLKARTSLTDENMKGMHAYHNNRN